MTKISNKQFFSLNFFLTRALFFGIGLSLMIDKAKEDVWISCILGVIFSSFIIFMINKIFNYDKNKNIFDILKSMKLRGKILLIIILAITLILMVVSLGIIINLVSSLFLYNTPLIVLGFPVVIIAYYGVFKGLETIGRTATIINGLSLFIIFIAATSLSPLINFNNFLPILNNSYKGILEGTLILISISTTPIFMMLMIKKSEIKNIKNNSLIINYLFTILTIIISILVTFSVLGPNLTSLFRYPEYIVLKKISILNFMENIENILAYLWIFDNFFTFLISTLFLKETINYVIINKKINIIIKVIFFATIPIYCIFYQAAYFKPLLTSYYHLPYLLIILNLAFIIPIFIYCLKKSKRN